MLRVSYLRTYGYAIYKDDKQKSKVKYHPCNGLVAMIYHDNKNKLAHLISFALDLKHLENCLKDNLDKDYIEKIVIYTNTDFKERYKVVQLYEKYGYPVQMRYCKRWKRNVKNKKTISK